MNDIIWHQYNEEKLNHLNIKIDTVRQLQWVEMKILKYHDWYSKTTTVSRNENT